MHDLLIRGGTVIDGTGMPGRTNDVAVVDGRVHAVGRHTGKARRTIDADGLIVAPGIIDAHTHYDPQITWDPLCDSSSLHGVTTVAAGNCGFSIAPVRQADRAYTAQMFGRVEGIDSAALERLPWDFETFEEYLHTRRGRLGVNLGMYVGHSAVRRWVMGEAAFQRESTSDELQEIVQLVERAIAAGALGLSSSHAPTHLDLADRPVPSRLSSLDELRVLAATIGRVGRGSIAYAPASAAEGISPADRDLLIELSALSGVPVITQGLGGRSKVDAPTRAWHEAREFLDRSAAARAPVYSLLMTRPVNGPFTLADGTSRYEGVPLWHELMRLSPTERHEVIADPSRRDALRRAVDNPNRDPAVGSTLPPPLWHAMRVSASDAPRNHVHVGRTIAAIANDLRQHPADVMFDIALRDDLRTVFHWSNETPEWRQLLREVQLHPQMIVGVSDGGAHLDRDDGAEWSTDFLATWWREEKVWRLEEAIRRITAIPAALLGLSDRGIIRAGNAADLFLFDPEHIGPGTCRAERDVVVGIERFRAVPRGVEATIVNGEVIVERGERLTATPGVVVRPT